MNREHGLHMSRVCLGSVFVLEHFCPDWKMSSVVKAGFSRVELSVMAMKS